MTHLHITASVATEEGRREREWSREGENGERQETFESDGGSHLWPSSHKKKRRKEVKKRDPRLENPINLDGLYRGNSNN